MHADTLEFLAASLTLLAGGTERVLIYSRDLYCWNLPLKRVKLQEETFKLKRFLRLRQVSNPGIGDSLTFTSSYTAYCLITPRRQLPSEGKLLDFITMRSRGHYIVDHMVKSYSDAFHIKRHRRCSKKLMTVHIELTDSDQSSKTSFEDLTIIGQRWSLTLSPMLSDAIPVRSIMTSSIKHRDIFTQRPLHGHLRCKEWMLLDS